MKKLLGSATIATLSLLVLASALPQDDVPPVQSQVLETDAGELVLAHTVTLEAPLAEVWEAYTTTEGWKAWVAPHAEVELAVGGTIRTNYVPDAQLGDEGTNRLEVVSYVPQELLILRSDVSQNWPDVMKKDADHLLNVITFHDLGEGRTRLRVLGTGYTKSAEMRELLGFFEEANARLLLGLVKHVETGR